MAQPSPPPGYLDAASSEPLHPAARAAWDAVQDVAWADPARRYGPGRRARVLLDSARESVAASLGCRADEVSFTGSGTQAVQLGVAGLALGRRRVGPTRVASAVEHSSVLHAVRADGEELVRLVPVDRSGRVDVRAFAAAVAEPAVALACLQAANHEVGTRQPVDDVAAHCREAGVPLLVDAAAAVGHGPIPSGWDVLTASAHKWGGPAGVGVLAVRTGTRWRSPLPADDRTTDRRVPGFEDVAGAVAAAAALEAVTADAPSEDARLRRLVDLVRGKVPVSIPDAVVLGDPDDRLPHLVTLSFLYVAGEDLLDELDRVGFAVTSGSACSSSSLEPSHVLLAMGALTQGNLRVSLPRGVDEQDVERFLAVLPDAVRSVRTSLHAEGL
jgi:cysteine desulfurase